MITQRDVRAWMSTRGWKPFRFQSECWDAVAEGRHGLLNAPTGSGKTYALFLGAMLRAQGNRGQGCRVLWVTPLRALSFDIAAAMRTAIDGLGSDWRVGVRTGDTSATEKKRQRTDPPEVLLITPESIHVLLSYKNGNDLFRSLDVIVVDEWHELLGSKRGVQTELALARLRTLSPSAVVWGISATIGNMDEAIDVLLGKDAPTARVVMPTGREGKHAPQMTTLMPKRIERFPWTGHLGIRLLDDAERVIRESTSTLVFTNTRSQAEIWYQQFLEKFPDYAGQMALHHGSLDPEVRRWVEDAIKNERLKVVFCTSSLDLGVDFAPVDTVIQVGSPKGVARFLQRAGRSGHRPDARSRIWFLPTHALEIVEGAAMRVAIEDRILENREPYRKPIDVLSQWLVTLACGDGFDPIQVLDEVRGTFAYADLEDDEWKWTLDFITRGGSSLTAYPEFRRVVDHDGIFIVADRRTALRHRMQIGTISSEASVNVQFLNGKNLGTIEEGFISRLEPGDEFWFGGRCLALVQVKDMTAYVERSTGTKGAVPRWVGGRLPLSSQMSETLRRMLHEAAHGIYRTPEMKRLRPLLELQAETSIVPTESQFLIETFTSNEGYHAFFYPFEGRLAHEGLAALLALRLSVIDTTTFSVAMNDYGFELVSHRPIPIRDGISHNVFSLQNLDHDLLHSANVSQIARRRFRDIARIAGLIFQGFPSKLKKVRHLQASSELFFDVFKEYDAHNLLLKQSIDETMAFQLDDARIRTALHRIEEQEIVIKEIKRPSPFCVPIMVDRLREKVGTERLESLIRRLVS